MSEHDTPLSPPEQAIHMASSFYAELTQGARDEEALVDIIEKLSPEERRENFVTACGLKSNFHVVGNIPLELVEYAEMALDHLANVIYCHAALVQILRADAAGSKFADEIELNNKVQKVLDGIADELAAIMEEEQNGQLIAEARFADRLWGKLQQVYP